MRIEFKGRNVSFPEEVKAHVEQRVGKVERQVSPLSRLELELEEARNPRVANRYTVEGTLYLKGVTLRAKESAPDPLPAANLVLEELARQVKRHRDKLRRRRERESARTIAEPPAWLAGRQKGLFLTS
jgi:putative sigma-54 modulation protein